ncbi:hypothetical protein CVT25_003763 [Psilocybe cyanescens]|uniref:Proliferating cell nuclear antigen PCNA N-terminal domain-containing protein n=1 Tax=Psilocybe cyanescens TaxID=93625 RepID=A0A409XTM8_PSICY|nr:hypothetical protein CVT25_003763 [Psilocybe cyanescens]
MPLPAPVTTLVCCWLPVATATTVTAGIVNQGRCIKLGASGFMCYCCNWPMLLGVNLTSHTKMLRCAKDGNIGTLKAADEVEVLNLVYAAKNSDSITEYDMKLM